MKLSNEQILSSLTIDLPEIMNLILSGEFEDKDVEQEENQNEISSLRSIDIV
jgi:hypothetical protein